MTRNILRHSATTLLEFLSMRIGKQDIRKTGYAEIYLTIYDAQGEQIESAANTEFGGDPTTMYADEMLTSLYTNARRMALGVDTALDTLLLELGA